jgi:hypothetical protein
MQCFVVVYWIYFSTTLSSFTLVLFYLLFVSRVYQERFCSIKMFIYSRSMFKDSSSTALYFVNINR